MSQCPYCSSENIDGVDLCEECHPRVLALLPPAEK